MVIKQKVTFTRDKGIKIEHIEFTEKKKSLCMPSTFVVMQTEYLRHCTNILPLISFGNSAI